MLRYRKTSFLWITGNTLLKTWKKVLSHPFLTGSIEQVVFSLNCDTFVCSCCLNFNVFEHFYRGWEHVVPCHSCKHALHWYITFTTVVSHLCLLQYYILGNHVIFKRLKSKIQYFFYLERTAGYWCISASSKECPPFPSISYVVHSAKHVWDKRRTSHSSGELRIDIRD